MNPKQQIIKYIFVGILNTLFGYLWYATFIFLGIQYTQALLSATILGILFNFKTIGKLVFKKSNNLLIFKFIGVYIFLYFINIGIISLLEQISSNLYTAGFISSILSAALGFILNKYFVFKE